MSHLQDFYYGFTGHPHRLPRISLQETSPVQNVTCYEDQSTTVEKCFTVPNGEPAPQGVYLDGVSKQGTACGWSASQPGGGDFNYWNNISKFRGDQKVYGAVNANEVVLEELTTMANCMKEAATPSKFVTNPVRWDGAYIDYEMTGGTPHCPSLNPLIKLLKEKPIYVNAEKRSTCYENEWKSHPTVVPVYPCYDGANAEACSHSPSNTAKAHYMYSETVETPEKPAAGPYDLYKHK